MEQTVSFFKPQKNFFSTEKESLLRTLSFSVLKKRACFAHSLNKHYYTLYKSTGTQPFRVSVSVLVHVYSSQCLQAKKYTKNEVSKVIFVRTSKKICLQKKIKIFF